ncbi:MAG: pentapeptide repeat-containing protein [Phycisphaerae bacterium]|nr:pentapeptide repeat-containing protein [Phycisphaerae bacterium]
MSDLDLASVWFRGSTFNGVKMDNTIFSACHDCVFNGVQGTSTYFGQLKNCSMWGAVLPEAELTTLLDGCTIENTSLAGVRFKPLDRLAGRDIAQHSRFLNVITDFADCAGCDLRGHTFSGCSFRNARASLANFAGCDISDTSFAFCNVVRANFDRTSCTSCDFEQTVILREQIPALRHFVASNCWHVVAAPSTDAVAAACRNLRSRGATISWTMTPQRGIRDDRLVVSAEEDNWPQYRGAALKGRRSAVQRSYTPDKSRDLVELLIDFACDYVGWGFNPSTLEVVQNEPVGIAGRDDEWRVLIASLIDPLWSET